jgi:hypothetical protein
MPPKKSSSQRLTNAQRRRYRYQQHQHRHAHPTNTTCTTNDLRIPTPAVPISSSHTQLSCSGPRRGGYLDDILHELSTCNAIALPAVLFPLIAAYVRSHQYVILLGGIEPNKFSVLALDTDIILSPTLSSTSTSITKASGMDEDLDTEWISLPSLPYPQRKPLVGLINDMIVVLHTLEFREGNCFVCSSFLMK